LLCAFVFQKYTSACRKGQAEEGNETKQEKGRGKKVVPVLNSLSTTTQRYMGQWMNGSTYS
jgi:hypothetical protein